MTEKEFEQLKVGDKVWYLTDLWSYTETKPYELLVVGKQNGCSYITTSWLDGTHVMNFSWLKSYLTKAEALEASIERCEARIKDKEDDIAYEKKELDRYKVELAKAKEEEEEKAKKIKPYYVTYLTGKVEKYPFVIEGYEYTTHFTEQEAYEALAEYYKRKLFKTLEKCGYKFAICCDKNIAVVKIDKDRGDIWWCYYYPHLSYGSVRKTNVFDTLEEAEAQLKREKDGD